MQDLILYPPTLPSTGTAWSTITGTPTTLAGYGITAAAAKIQTQEMFLVNIPVPTNQTYFLVVNSAHAGTISNVTTYAQSGTCTMAVFISGVQIGGSANSVSNVQQVTTHSSNNSFAAADYIALFVSANSTCRDMSVNIQYTRTYQ